MSDIVASRAGLVVVVLAGFVLVPTIAKAQPTLINGFLILLLVGVVLGNSSKWLPYLNAVNKQGTASSGGGSRILPGGKIAT